MHNAHIKQRYIQLCCIVGTVENDFPEPERIQCAAKADFTIP